MNQDEPKDCQKGCGITVELSRQEIDLLLFLLNKHIIKLGERRLWFPRLGQKSAWEKERDMWCELRDKLNRI